MPDSLNQYFILKKLVLKHKVHKNDSINLVLKHIKFKKYQYCIRNSNFEPKTKVLKITKN